QDGDLQQRVSGHGPPMATVLSRPPLLGHADLEPGLCPSRGGVWDPRLASGDRVGGGAGGAGGSRPTGAGAGRVPHRAGSQRLSDDPPGRVPVRADRVGSGVAAARAGMSAAHAGMSAAHAVTVLMEDRLITLTRAVGLLRRRNLPVRSIAVGPTATPGLSRLTIMIQSDDTAADRAVKHLQKMIGVREATTFAAQDGVARELALVKVRAPAERYGELLDVVQLYHASVVDDSP